MTVGFKSVVGAVLLVCIFASKPMANESNANKQIHKAVAQLVQALTTAMGVNQNSPRKVAVSALVSLGPLAREKQMGEVVAELLQEKLAKVSGVTLIERVQLKKILEELKLSLLGLTDSSNAGAVGKLAGADAMLVGSVSEVGADFRISLRLVDVKSGKVEKSLAANMSQQSMVALSSEYIVTRTKSDAIFRSLLIPGWGQFYNNENLRGTLYLSAVVGAGAGAVAAFLLSSQSQNEYDQATKQVDLDSAAAAFSSQRKIQPEFGLLIFLTQQ